ncbi:MAG: tetratricopeptide repeat protein, partial [Parvibaculales bacterium]
SGDFLSAQYAIYEKDSDEARVLYEAALAHAPDSPTLLRKVFQVSLLTGNMPQAIEMAQKLEKKEEGFPLSHLMLAVYEMNRGKYKRVAGHLKQIPPEPFNVLISDIIYSWAEYGKGSYLNAQGKLIKMEDEKAFRLIAHYGQALFAEREENILETTHQYQKAMQNGGLRYSQIVSDFGKYLQRNKRGKDAQTVYETYMSFYGSSPNIIADMQNLETSTSPTKLYDSPAKGLARSLLLVADILSQENPQNIGEPYARLAYYLDPSLEQAVLLLGDFAQRAKDWNRALQEYARLPQNSIWHVEAEMETALVLSKIDKITQAENLLKDLGKQYPSNPKPYIQLGDLWRTNDKFENAIGAYSTALKRIGEIEVIHWPILFSRGISYERAKKWEKAEQDLQEAVELSNENAEVLNYLGYSWIEQGIHLAKAMQMLQKAAKKSPNSGHILDSLGWAHYRLTEFENAVATLEKAIRLMPDDPVINDHFADALWQVGRHIEARYQWKRVLALNPDEELAEQVQKKYLSGLE